jgi:hypothetical protein
MDEKYCEFCGSVFDGALVNHLRICKNYKKCIINLESKLTFDFLYDEYIIKEKSIRQISKEIGFKKPRQVHKKLLEYNIPLRNAHENRFAKGYIEQTKSTCLEKYGCEYHTLKESSIRQKIWDGVEEKYGVKYISLLPETIEKIKKTNLKKYGVENVGQSDKIKQKVKDTCLIRYGVYNPFMNIDVINKIKETKATKIYTTSHTSAIAESFFTLLYEKISSSDHIYFRPKTKEFTIMSDENILYCYDFVDSEKKKCIEFNGNYWHGNPSIYENDWINPHSSLSMKEMKLKDKKKINAIKKRGYKCLIVWEKEYKDNPEKIFKKCIRFLNKFCND